MSGALPLPLPQHVNAVLDVADRTWWTLTDEERAATCEWLVENGLDPDRVRRIELLDEGLIEVEQLALNEDGSSAFYRDPECTDGHYACGGDFIHETQQAVVSAFPPAWPL
jgi:hypothetical protein